MKILMTGPQGSGKTTQAHILAEKYKFRLIKTGEFFRKLAEEDSERGRMIKRLSLDAGELISDELTAEIVREKLKDEGIEDDFIFDGYPRTIHQIELFDPKFDLVFDLEISDEVAIERMLKRGRADDTLPLIKKRLELYYKETVPVLEYYKKQGKLITVDGEKTIEEVALEIDRRLKWED